MIWTAWIGLLVKLDFVSRITLQEIQQGDRRPLVALLLGSLPNLVRIRVHVPSSDPYLAALLKLALERERPSPLNRLRELYVFAEVPVVPGHDMQVGDDPDRPVAPLRLHDL
ncbi:hypothetical protein BJX68DRAFT_268907 [Aspergillus pseudodeflectus]|uniref:Uncharacterized protein n=1 Tax=Aspergillus pseudodeflectus TaxID=176178 RepID=A0ABR4K1A3_9EURO